MRKLIFSILVLTLAACEKHADVSGGTRPSEFKQRVAVDNEFVFKGKPEVVAELLKKQGIEHKITPVFQSGGDQYHVQYKGPASYAALEKQIASTVEYIQPNYIYTITSSKNRHEWPTNKLFFKQWALNNVGQSPPFGVPGTEGADMDILKAWSLSKGSKEIIVAVIDEGVDYTHPALKDNMWVNEKEAPINGGIAGVDDDGNGYVDDVYGFDFYSKDKTKLWYDKVGGPDPMDHGGHGTFCAGEIAAIPNTNVGIAGINWNVRIMAVRFLGDGGGTSVDAARAIEYARINHADIMSNSWGGGGDSPLLQEAIAQASKQGILFVVAAGNEGEDIELKKTYPASYKTDKNHQPLGNVMTVGASDNQDNPAEWSNYGQETVDVFAPGVEIVSTFPKALLPKDVDPYVIMSGTSMATPYVAGVAALMLAHDSGLRHHPEKVIELVQKTADVKPSLIGKTISNGRINAFKALSGIGANPVLSANWQSSGQSISQKGFAKDLVDIRKDVTIPNAQAIRLHFDFIQIESPFDSIYIYDRDYRLITEIDVSDSANYWSPIIPGDTVHVRFVNALVKKITMVVMEEDSSDSCEAAGATEVSSKPDGKFTCQVDKASTDDSDDSGGGGSKPYSTFNSEGFEIDQIQFVAASSGGNQ